MDNTMNNFISCVRSMLQEQYEEQERIVRWLGKFCSHVDNDFRPLPDEENTKFFQNKMNEQFGWDVDIDE